MNLKSTLKFLKLNESTISMLLGALVIVIVGMLVVNYFRSNEPGTAFPDGASTEEKVSLPATHTVQEGETLWSIAEKYYQSGYNWVDIAKANNLTTANVIEQGQELTIPDVTARTVDQPTPTADSFAAAPEVTPATQPTATPVKIDVENVKEDVKTHISSDSLTDPISADSYTVVHGDNLWNISVRAYGDGFRWVEIARANNLANPNLIHAGNHFTIPR